MKKLLIIPILFAMLSCGYMFKGRESIDMNTQMQVSLISWKYHSWEHRADLVSINRCGDTCYLNYGWYGRKPRFYEGMGLTIFYDSVQRRKNIWIEVKIKINN